MIKNFLFIKDIIKIKLGINRILPISASIDLTELCNLKCSMCNLWQKKEKSFTLTPAILEKQFSTSKFLKNLYVVNFGGGEPFLINNLEEYIYPFYKYSKCSQIRIVTNGYLTDRIIKKTKELLKLFNTEIGIKISIDGMKEIHNKIRGNPNAFDNGIKTAEKLKEIKNETKNRLNISLGFTINSLNYNQIVDVFELSKKIGIGFLAKPIINVEKFCGNNFNKNLILNNEQKKIAVEQISTILKRSVEGFIEKIIFKNFHKLVLNYLIEEKRYCKCYAGFNSFYMTADGSITTCLLLNKSIGNINNQDFDDIWIGEKAKQIRAKISEQNYCNCITPCDTLPSYIIDTFPLYF